MMLCLQLTLSVGLVPAGGVAQYRVRLGPGGQQMPLHGYGTERRGVPAAEAAAAPLVDSWWLARKLW